MSTTLKKLQGFEGVKGPVVTIVMDGVGLAPETAGNAVFAAKRDLEKIPEKNTFTFYGVKDIDGFKNKIEGMKK